MQGIVQSRLGGGRILGNQANLGLSFKQILLVWIKQKILPPLLVLDPSVKWER